VVVPTARSKRLELPRQKTRTGRRLTSSHLSPPAKPLKTHRNPTASTKYRRTARHRGDPRVGHLQCRLVRKARVALARPRVAWPLEFEEECLILAAEILVKSRVPLAASRLTLLSPLLLPLLLLLLLLARAGGDSLIYVTEPGYTYPQLLLHFRPAMVMACLLEYIVECHPSYEGIACEE